MNQLAVAVTVDDVAQELYGLAPEDFVAARRRYADEARSAGDPRRAAEILGLGKPSTGAWMSNQLVRWWRPQVLELIDLGRALRHATQNLRGDDLWELSDRRKWAERELLEGIEHLAVEDRVALSAVSRRALADTLQAAVCSEEMAARMLTGRLVRSLVKISWPGLTPETFRDELACRRARRLSEQAGRPTRRPGNGNNDGNADDNANHNGNDNADEDRIAPVIALTARRVRR